MTALSLPHLRIGDGRRSRIIARAVAVLVVLVAVALGTHVVDDSSSLASGPQKFSPATFAAKNFDSVQAAIAKRAVPAATLAAALHAGTAAATKRYAVEVPGAVGPEFSVTFTGVAGTPVSGVYPVRVAGLPAGLLVRIQTGPAINGTDLRDAPGTITFGQFTNQIDYQNAAAALNTQLKKTVLATATARPLTGRTVTVTGAFQLINPQGWLVTPSQLSVR